MSANNANHFLANREPNRQIVNRPGRLIQMHAGGPAENIAIDQALLESVDVDGRPVLRLYSWSEPTLSIGYFQKIGDRVMHRESTGLACVRRSTGGGGIVHHHELTYSVAIPSEAALSGPRMDLYAKAHFAMTDSLSDFGVRAIPVRQLGEGSDSNPDSFLCFQRRTSEDLIISGYKVLGSAQRTARRAILQHGSLLVQASRWAPQLPGVIDLSSRSISIGQIAESFSAALAEVLGINWNVDEISLAERGRAVEIANEKFASERWMFRR